MKSYLIIIAFSFAASNINAFMPIKDISQIDCQFGSNPTFCERLKEMFEIIEEDGFLTLRGQLLECDTSFFMMDVECLYECNFTISEISQSQIETTLAFDLFYDEITYTGAIGEGGTFEKMNNAFDKYLIILKKCIPSYFDSEGKLVHDSIEKGYWWKSISDDDTWIVMLFVHTPDPRINECFLNIQILYEYNYPSVNE